MKNDSFVRKRVSAITFSNFWNKKNDIFCLDEKVCDRADNLPDFDSDSANIVYLFINFLQTYEIGYLYWVYHFSR